MKICQNCQRENKGRYAHLCATCYSKKCLLSHSQKPCLVCLKTYLGFGKICQSCTRKIREENSKGVKCSNCLRTHLRIKNKSLILCTTCHRKKLEKEIDGYREKRILYNRQSHRKYRGKEPFGPLRKRAAGEGHINKQGYKIVARVGHPNANALYGAIAEHIWVMSEHLSRPLRKGETVHHKNGIRDDNRIENLELWHKSQPPGQRVIDKIDWAKRFLEEYGFKVDSGDNCLVKL